jgi:hypothetical protein
MDALATIARLLLLLFQLACSTGNTAKPSAPAFPTQEAPSLNELRVIADDETVVASN